MSDLSRRLREPLPLLLLILAVAGWLAFLAMWINATLAGSRDQDAIKLLVHEREQLTSSIAQRDATQGDISAAQAKLMDVQQKLDGLTASYTAANTEFEAKQNELQSVTENLTQAQQDSASLLEQAEAARQLLNDAATRQAAIQAETESVTRQLADVDTRLTEARRLEETTTTSLAQMAEEAAKTTSTLAETQTQLQSSRADLVSTQERLSEAQSLASDATVEAEEAQAEIEELEQRRARLEAEVAAYGEQIGVLQPQVEELTRTLAQRSERLKTVEAIIAQAIATPKPQHLYRATEAGLTLTLAENGDFTLRDTINRTVSGRYTKENGVLVLSQATGQVGNAQFPMNCPYTEANDELTLQTSDGCSLGGLTFALVK